MTLVAPFAKIDADLAVQAHVLLDNVVVTPTNGVPFTAMFDQTDKTAFDVTSVGDYSLRYLAAAAPELRKGDLIEIDGRSFSLAEAPRRYDAYDKVVALIEATV